MKKGFWIQVKDIIKKVDVILEVLDARMPELTRNRKLENYAKKFNRPVILVINKSDLVTKALINNIKKRYHNLNYAIISSKNSQGINKLIKLIKKKSKNPKIKVAIIGYPNTGKSSLINRLSLGGRTKTSSESGFTRGLQLISGKQNLMLFDTPGVVPFEARDEIRLGIISGISPSKLKDPDLVAYKLIKIFKLNNPDALEKTYQVNMKQIPEKILQELGKKRNMLKQGGIVDERRAAIQLLSDWHKGKIKI